jgi:hypothetical protein
MPSGLSFCPTRARVRQSVSLAFFVTHFSPNNHGYLPLLLLFLGAVGIGVALIFSRVIYYVKHMEKWMGELFLMAASRFGFFGYLQA